MSFRISCETREKITYFKIVGEAANHLDSIARYVRAKVADRRGFVVDIRSVTARPLADKVFIHVLKYPPGCLRKLALIDGNENRPFCALYQRLARTRGYQVRYFDDVDTANQWVSSDEPLACHGRWSFLGNGLTVLRHSLNPMRLLHAATR